MKRETSVEGLDAAGEGVSLKPSAPRASAAGNGTGGEHGETPSDSDVVLVLTGHAFDGSSVVESGARLSAIVAAVSLASDASDAPLRFKARMLCASPADAQRAAGAVKERMAHSEVASAPGSFSGLRVEGSEVRFSGQGRYDEILRWVCQ